MFLLFDESAKWVNDNIVGIQQKNMIYNKNNDILPQNRIICLCFIKASREKKYL